MTTDGCGQIMDGVMQRRDAVGDDPTADEKHRGRPGHGEPPHQPRCSGEQPTTEAR